MCGSSPYKVASPQKLHNSLLPFAHNHHTSGHCGRDATFNNLRSRCFWKGMWTDVANHVKNCRVCQFFSPPNKVTPGLMQPILPPQAPFARVAIDYVGPLPSTRFGNLEALVMVDQTTGYVIAIPCKRSNAATTISIVLNNLVYRFGLPRYIVSDNGRHI